MELIGALAGGETPTATDSQRVLRSLNSMLDSWSNERGFIYALTQETLALDGSQSYTIGEDGTPDFDTVRPLEIDPTTFVRSGNSDYPLTILTQDEYAAIQNKSFSGSLPDSLYYDPTYPNGTLYLFPAAQGSLHLSSWKPLSTFSLLTTALSMPPGYQRAIEYNLALEILPLFALPEPSTLARLAKQARRAIKHKNAPRVSMSLPRELVRRGRFNILTGY